MAHPSKADQEPSSYFSSNFQLQKQKDLAHKPPTSRLAPTSGKGPRAGGNDKDWTEFSLEIIRECPLSVVPSTNNQELSQCK